MFAGLYRCITIFSLLQIPHSFNYYYIEKLKIKREHRIFCIREMQNMTNG